MRILQWRLSEKNRERRTCGAVVRGAKNPWDLQHWAQVTRADRPLDKPSLSADMTIRASRATNFVLQFEQFLGFGILLSYVQ